MARAAEIVKTKEPIRNNRTVIWEHFLDTVVVLACEISLYVVLKWTQGFFSIPEDVFRYIHLVLRWFTTATVGWFAVDSIFRIICRSVREIARARF